MVSPLLDVYNNWLLRQSTLNSCNKKAAAFEFNVFLFSQGKQKENP